jgi:hypothetical protein
MKIQKSILTAAAVVVLTAFSGIALASPNPQEQSSRTATKPAIPKSQIKSVTGISRGTITSMDHDRLVLSHKKLLHKAEELTFMLSPTTERIGDLKPGAQVSVHYRTENNQLLATVIQAKPRNIASANGAVQN